MVFIPVISARAQYLFSFVDYVLIFFSIDLHNDNTEFKRLGFICGHGAVHRYSSLWFVLSVAPAYLLYSLLV